MQYFTYQNRSKNRIVITIFLLELKKQFCVIGIRYMDMGFEKIFLFWIIYENHKSSKPVRAEPKERNAKTCQVCSRIDR